MGCSQSSKVSQLFLPSYQIPNISIFVHIYIYIHTHPLNAYRSLTITDEQNQVPIYNYVSKDNSITNNKLKVLSEKYGFEFPTGKAIWYYSFRYNKHKIIHFFYVYFLHLLPALLIDTVTLCLGKQPR